MKTLLKTLTQTPGPSGYENPIREAILKEISSLSKNIRVDNLGSLVVTLGQKSAKGKKVMIAAHMDEIGVMVSHVEKSGLVRFTNLGTFLPRYLTGGRVRFLNGVKGVINTDRSDELTKIPSIDKHFIDVGANSDKDCPLKIGDEGVFEGDFTVLGDRVASKAMDNRSSCAVVIETMRAIHNTPHELVFVFSAQEEVGSRGAGTAAYEIEPDLALAVDTTPVGDILGVKMQTELGKGPAIKVRDVFMISDPRVVRWMESGAKQAGVTCQMEVLDVGTTDARTMQIAKAGMPTGALSLPCRYVHSPSEVVDISDLTSAVKLLTYLLSHEITLK